MKFFTLLGIGTLIGLGIYINKKLSEEKNEGVVYADEKETLGKKVRKASVIAVGTVKHGIDKIAEGLREAPISELRKKGEETVEMMKNSAESIKKDIIDLKDMMVTAVNTNNEPEIEEEIEGLNSEFGVNETAKGDETQKSVFDDLEEI
ncbi:MAG: hypothetical protein LBR74_02155 [Eubacterium sp.]|jgi:hypothetical protein|nr:hypothetical protein [Eubacterium sp.]